MRKKSLGVGTCMFALALSACGGGQKVAPATGDGGANGSTVTIASAASLSSPVFQEPEYKAGMEAAIGSVNAAGGVDGHRLALDFCDTGYTANGEIGCARKMSTSKPAAVVGPDFFVDGSGAVWKTLEAAKLPVVGDLGGSPVELNSANVFPLGSGVPGAFSGAAAAIVKAGAKKITVLIDTNPSGQFAAQLITSALKRASITPVGTTVADTSSDPTYATAAAKATKGDPDGAVLVGAPGEVARMISALRSGGFAGKIATAAILLPQQSIDQLKSGAEGVIVDSILAVPSDAANPGVSKFQSDMKKYQPDAKVDDNSLTAWSAVQLFAKAAAGTKTYDPAGLTSTFAGLRQTLDIGTIAPWSVAGRTSPYPGFTRIVNPRITFGVVTGGKVTSDGTGFVDPLTLLSH